MREIKFRKYERHYLWGGKKEFEESMIYGFESDYSVGSYLQNTLYNKNIYNEDGDVCVLMQYVGAKDKNGKEIYEGDIIKYSIKGKGKDWKIVEVQWDSDVCGFYFYQEWYEIENPRHGKDVEVIGNIYENPEMLELLTKKDEPIII